MNGIQVKYTELFRLSVQQLFYNNKLFKQDKTAPETDIYLLPTAGTTNTFNRMNLVFKNTDAGAGFILLARVDGTNGAGDDVLRYPAKNDVLVFLMTLKNPDVINFNDLPSQPLADHIYYFSNQVNDAAAPRNNLHLSKNASGTDGTIDIIKKSAEGYSYHSSTVINPGTATIKHIASGAVKEPASIITTGGQTDITFNLAGLPAGKCQLLINTTVTDEFYYLERYNDQPIFGIIELSLSSALDANYRIIETDNSLKPAKPFYTITFNNRPTFWRYIIQLRETSPLYLEMAALSPADKAAFINMLNIESNDTAIDFTRQSATDTQFVFISNNNILLQEKYVSSSSLTHDLLTLTLKKYIGDARVDIVKTNLPYPATTMIDATTLPNIFSDIFLTI